MLALIKTGASYGPLLTVDPAFTPMLVALAPHLRMVHQSGYGESLAYKLSNLSPEVTFVENAVLIEPGSPVEALQTELSQRCEQWLQATARIAELERELAVARGETVP